MKIAAALLLGIVLTALPITAMQRKQNVPSSASTASPQDAASPQGPRGPCDPRLNERERQELQRDLDRMRSLIQQMQRNLAAAATGESPLKHQFQLEIDMWQIMLDRLEKRGQPPARQ